MPRRTIYLSKSTEERVRELAHEDESFSAAVARLVELGADVVAGKRVPSYVGSGESDVDDLGINAEKYLREAFEDFSD